MRVEIGELSNLYMKKLSIIIMLIIELRKEGGKEKKIMAWALG